MNRVICRYYACSPMKNMTGAGMSADGGLPAAFMLVEVSSKASAPLSSSMPPDTRGANPPTGVKRGLVSNFFIIK